MKKSRNKILFTCPMSKIMPIIRPVGNACNLKCAYCYYNSTDQRMHSDRVMSNNILEAFISQFLELSGDEVTFVWHGGEPLLAGQDFFKNVIDFENKYKRKGQIIKNNIQTNGSLITHSWASFFKENDFHIGMSLDGISYCHDKFRKNNNGGGSFSKIIEAIKLLREYDIEPGILQTATRFSLAYIKENFNFFVDDLKLKKWGINVYNDIGNSNPILKDQSLSNDEYFFLYKSIFALWIERNDPSIEIREINTFTSGIFGKYSGICQNSGICSSFIALDSDGTITPTCESYYFDDKFRRNTNILNKSLLDILNGDERLNFAKVINDIPSECAKCKWYVACFNGCTMQRDKKNHFLYCNGRKKLFSYLWEYYYNVQL